MERILGMIMEYRLFSSHLIPLIDSYTTRSSLQYSKVPVTDSQVTFNLNQKGTKSRPFIPRRRQPEDWTDTFRAVPCSVGLSRRLARNETSWVTDVFHVCSAAAILVNRIAEMDR